MHFLRIVRVAGFVFDFIKNQKRFNAIFIPATLQPFEEHYGHRLKDQAQKKIYNYYCLGIPVTCAIYKKLYGRDLSAKERELVTLAGVITPLIDDFTDDKTLSQQQIESLTSHPEEYEPATIEEAVVKSALKRLIIEVPAPAEALGALQQTVRAQSRSALQMQDDITEEELWQIALDKGAWSHMLFHYLIDEVPGEAVLQVLNKMGGMLQMSNDLFDVYKDSQEGIKTVPLTCGNFQELEDTYMNECRQFCKMARNLPYKYADKEFFITFIAIIMARGMVALRQLKSLQKELGGGVLPVNSLSRKQLICDMEKPINMLRTVWHTYRIVRI